VKRQWRSGRITFYQLKCGGQVGLISVHKKNPAKRGIVSISGES
jgi:hypothetical protein